VQPQAPALQVWLVVLQHCPAVQSADVQQALHVPLQQTNPSPH
jgi:hypothetical protein